MPSPTNKKSSFSLIILLLLIAIIIYAVFHRQNIYDDIKLYGYSPPSYVSDLSINNTFTSYSNKIFKVNHPLLESKKTFFTNCPKNGGEKSIILGCYHSNQKGIFLLNVSDPKLNGVEEVTAAHEMLHAAYDRLNVSDKNKVNAMLLDFYNNGLNDQRIKSTINFYKQTEPNDLVNEMHSVFGTEVATLPTNLENYYKKYFNNRQAVVRFANQYQSQFTSLQQMVKSEELILNSLKSKINSLETDLASKKSTLNSLSTNLNNLKASNDIAGYNNAVVQYNSLVVSYNSEVTQVKQLINQYNAVVNQRNAQALAENQLYQELSGNINNAQ